MTPPPADPQDVDELGPVLVVGTGLIGASVGRALTSQGVRVHLRDLNPSNAMVAAGRGAGVLDEPSSCRIVVVATPPAAVAQTVAAALAEFPGAVVTDTASVKGAVVDELASMGVDARRYVGSHPMAGTQYAGPLTAVAELFVDRTWVVTPRAENSRDDVELVRRMARVTGARVVEMDTAEHDRAVAEVSHLPHLMSILTAANLRHAERPHLRLAGTGVRDVTRIARSQTGMWRQILSANRPAVRAQLEAVRADLDALLASLDDPDELEGFLEEGRRGAQAVSGKHGREVVTEAVIVQIPDAPGSLARLFADVEGIVINVEDLSVEHDPEREVGFLSIDVAPERADDLRAWMRSRGWGLRS